MSVAPLNVNEIIHRYYTPLDDDLADYRKVNESDGIPLIMRETEEALRLLLSILKPQNILEIGTAAGYSSLFFAKLLPIARITTIERNPYMIEKARSAFSSHTEGSRIDLRTGDAIEILRSLQDEINSQRSSRKYDFVFIDAAKSHYREFLELAEDIITEDACIVCDNIMFKKLYEDGSDKDIKRHRTNIKYMRLFLDYINLRKDLDVNILSCGDGLAIIRYK